MHNGGAGGGGCGQGIYPDLKYDRVILLESTNGHINTGGGAGGVFGAGAGGGYTTTVLGASVTPGQQLSVVVGSGGAGGSSIFNGETYAGGNGGSGICIIRWGKR